MAKKTTLEKLRQKKVKLLKEIQEEAQNFFKDESSKLFKKFKGLDEFGWRQYTIYFNDGDQCYFSAYTDEPEINGMDSYEEDDDENAPGDSELIRDAVTEFLAEFETSEFEMMFGDHVSITVNRDGVHTREYTQHD